MSDDLVAMLRRYFPADMKHEYPQTCLTEYEYERQKASDCIEKLEAVTKDDAKWLAAYHQWCKMNGCAPSSSDLIAASEALNDRPVYKEGYRAVEEAMGHPSPEFWIGDRND